MLADGPSPPVQSSSPLMEPTGACGPLPIQSGRDLTLNTSDEESGQRSFNPTEVRDVLQMWLDWNQRYENLTHLMYQHATNFHTLQQLADELDRLRLHALAQTAELLRRLGKA